MCKSWHKSPLKLLLERCKMWVGRRLQQVWRRVVQDMDALEEEEAVSRDDEIAVSPRQWLSFVIVIRRG